MMYKLIILGCRAPSQSMGGFSSLAIIYGGDVILIDAGECVQRYLSLAGISLARVSKIFISHLHGDHVLGLIPLMESRSLLGIQKELVVYGPRGIKEFVERNMELLNFTPSYEYRVVEGRDITVEDRNYVIKSFNVSHSVETLGFRFDVKNHALVYTSDTLPCDEVIKNSEGAYVLIHDSTYSVQDVDKARKHMHSTAVDAATTATAAGVKTLILYHISTRYSDTARLLHEARAKFFNTLVADELMKIII